MNQLTGSNWRKRRRSQDAIDLSLTGDATVEEHLESVDSQRVKRCRHVWPVVGQEPEPQRWPSSSRDILSRNTGDALQGNKTPHDNLTTSFPVSSLPPVPLLVTSNPSSEMLNQVGIDQTTLNCPHMPHAALRNRYLSEELLQDHSSSHVHLSSSLPHPASVVTANNDARYKLPPHNSASSTGSWALYENGATPQTVAQPSGHSTWPAMHAALHQATPPQMSYVPHLHHGVDVTNGATPSYAHHPNFMRPFIGHMAGNHGPLHSDPVMEPHVSYFPVFGTQYHTSLSSWLSPVSQMMMHNSYAAARIRDFLYVHPPAIQHSSAPHHIHGILPPVGPSQDGFIHHFLSLIGNYRSLPYIRNIPGTEVENYEALLNLAELLSGKQPRGLTRHEMDRLVAYRYKSEGRSSPSDQTSCVVCMCDFENKQMLRVLPCSHEFHAKCIDKWLKINQTCPICRSSALDLVAGPGKN